MKNKGDMQSASIEKHGSFGNANLLTLEFCFLAILAFTVVIAFFESLTYKMVSARTPLVIIVPLFFLIALQSLRLLQARKLTYFRNTLLIALRGGLSGLNKICAIVGWMAGFLVLILSLGHYIGMLAFTFSLLRLVSVEKLKLSVLVSVTTTGIVFMLFEYGFNIEMYRGLLYRYYSGYSDF